MDNALVESRLKAARQAVDVVKAKLRLGRGNKFDPVVANNLEKIALKAGYPPALASLGRLAAGPVAAIAEAKIIAYRIEDVLAGSKLQGIERIRECANQALKARAGNCSDQSCVAFIELYDHSVRPLDLMFLTNDKHAFVVIGKRGTSGQNPSTWGPELVVCDPWNNDAYWLDPAHAESVLLAKMKCECSQAKSQFHVQ